MDKTTNLKQKFLKELASTQIYGNISLACKKVGISRQSIYNWKHTDYVFSGELEFLTEMGRENLADLAENALSQKVKSGDTTAIIFALKTLRRKFYYQTEYNVPLTYDQTHTIPRTEEEKQMMQEILAKYGDHAKHRNNTI